MPMKALKSIIFFTNVARCDKSVYFDSDSLNILNSEEAKVLDVLIDDCDYMSIDENIDFELYENNDSLISMNDQNFIEMKHTAVNQEELANKTALDTSKSPDEAKKRYPGYLDDCTSIIINPIN